MFLSFSLVAGMWNREAIHPMDAWKRQRAVIQACSHGGLGQVPPTLTKFVLHRPKNLTNTILTAVILQYS